MTFGDMRMSLRLSFGVAGTPAYREAACIFGEGCAFTYMANEGKPGSICYRWQFETAPVAGRYVVGDIRASSGEILEAAADNILEAPDGSTVAQAASPYGPNPAGGANFGASLSGTPRLFAKDIHLGYADFTLSAWVKIPDFTQCGGAPNATHCAVAGKMMPQFDPNSQYPDEWCEPRDMQ